MSFVNALLVKDKSGCKCTSNYLFASKIQKLAMLYYSSMTKKFTHTTIRRDTVEGLKDLEQ